MRACNMVFMVNDYLTIIMLLVMFHYILFACTTTYTIVIRAVALVLSFLFNIFLEYSSKLNDFISLKRLTTYTIF